MLIFVFPHLFVFWLLVYIVYTSLFNIIALTYQKKKKREDIGGSVLLLELYAFQLLYCYQ